MKLLIPSQRFLTDDDPLMEYAEIGKLINLSKQQTQKVCVLAVRKLWNQRLYDLSLNYRKLPKVRRSKNERKRDE